MENILWQNFRDKNVQILTVNREETIDKAREFVEQNKWSFPSFIDPKREFYSQFTPKYIPWNVIIDQNGIIQYSEPGFNQEKFELILNQLTSK
ncbi:TlpA family protein disulfide reductase [candidate division KSB1 bacterium]|nr:TlpA family protein disulfide reductase [candidate division KSB1 bacterium]